MRRPALYIAVALLTFVAIIFTGDAPTYLIIALPVALVLFLLLEEFAGLNILPHALKVALFTALLWIPALAFFSYVLAPLGSFSCEPDYFSAETGTVEVTEEVTPLTAPIVYTCEGRPAFETDCSCAGRCDGFNVGKPKTAVAVGVLNDKAVSKPQPLYPLMAKSACVKGTVTVWVVVSAITGRVIWAQAVSGHPLLRQSARDAACQARFHPTLYSGPVINVSGILIYDFG